MDSNLSDFDTTSDTNADLVDSIESRVNSVTQKADHLTVFAATQQVSLQSGHRIDMKITTSCGESFYEAFGVKEVKQLMKVVSKMPKVREAEVYFDQRMGHKYSMAIKTAVSVGVLGGLCPHWFINLENQ